MYIELIEMLNGGERLKMKLHNVDTALEYSCHVTSLRTFPQMLNFFSISYR